MKPQAMRRTILLDIPRNVTPREYAFYSAQWALVLVGFVGAVGTLVASLRGAAQKSVVALESTPSLSVAEATATTERMPLVRVEAVLHASNATVMPGEPSVEVILGSLELIVNNTEKRGESKKAVLYAWKHAPESLSLVDGEATLPLNIESELIPSTQRSKFGQPERLTDGAGARLSKTVGYRYLDKDWALPEEWGPLGSSSAHVERSYVEAGSAFVVTGELTPGADGSTLTVDQANGGGIHAGTMEEIRASAKKLGTRLRFAWIPLSLGAFWLLRRVLRTRRDFVRRSNAL